MCALCWEPRRPDKIIIISEDLHAVFKSMLKLLKEARTASANADFVFATPSPSRHPHLPVGLRALSILFDSLSRRVWRGGVGRGGEGGAAVPTPISCDSAGGFFFLLLLLRLRKNFCRIPVGVLF